MWESPFKSFSILFYQVDSDTRLAVQEALSLMSSAFKDLDEENLKLMEASLMENIDKVSVTSEHIQGINTIIKCGT